jgi:hypothetical protein
VFSMPHGNSQNSPQRSFDRHSDHSAMAIFSGGFMAGQLRQETLTQSAPGDDEPECGSMSTYATRWREQKWQQEQEKQWECHLSNLQQCVCELLIKNQQLRESLNQYQEVENE